MTIPKRIIAIVFFAYAFMLSQANPAQGTLSFLYEQWGFMGIWAFMTWFLLSAIYLWAWPYDFRGIYLGIACQVGYTTYALGYVVFDGLVRNHGAQWGAATTHGSVCILLFLIIWLLRKIELGKFDGLIHTD